MSRAKAIRQKCLDCGNGYKGANFCTFTDCQLYRYRMNPTGLPSGMTYFDRRRAIADYCLEFCCLGQSIEVKYCSAEDCPLWPYRYASTVKKIEGKKPHRVPADPTIKPLKSDHVMITQNTFIATSNKVAEVFGKEHKHVMRDIRELDCSPEFYGSNFKLIEIIDKSDSNLPINRSYCEMTRDGFVFLCMGFNGPKAAQFKEQYIAEFNRMAGAAPCIPTVEAAVLALRKTKKLAV